MNVQTFVSSRTVMRLVVLGLMACSLMGCSRTLPRRTVPDAEMPSVDLSRARPVDTGRLVVDVPDGSVPVSRITLRTEPSGEHVRFVEEPTEICAATPCVLDLPLGNHLLAFPVQGDEGATSTPELVHVGEEPSVFRRNLDLFVDDRRALLRAGGVFLGLAVLAMIVGVVVLQGAADGDEGRNERRIGALTAAGGFVVAVPSYLMVRFGTPTTTPGSSIHFPVR